MVKFNLKELKDEAYDLARLKSSTNEHYAFNAFLIRGVDNRGKDAEKRERINQFRLEEQRDMLERPNLENLARRNKAKEDALAWGVFGVSMAGLLSQFVRMYAGKMANNPEILTNIDEFANKQGLLTLALATAAAYGIYKSGKYAYHRLVEATSPVGFVVMDNYLEKKYPDAELLADQGHHI